MNDPMSETFICPHCGAAVPAGAQACPECGSDEKTGWSENTIYDGTGIEDPDDFDYEDWQRRDGVGQPRRSPRQLLIWIIALLLLVTLVVLLWH
jgi:RNA polymerase subunit RPABC4/transcription elongation factor Spt4